MLLLQATTGRAAVILSTDRSDVTLEDIVTLTLRVTDGEDLSNAEVGDLRDAFEILGSSTNSRTSLINGNMESYSELIITMSPTTTGTIVIGPATVDGKESNQLTIKVSEPAKAVPGTLEPVFISSSTDHNEIYVQGQVLYTLRIFHSVNLSEPSLSDLTIDDALVKVVAENRFQTRINGILHGVYEFKYAIFPQKSGVLIIPPQTFRATEGRRSSNLFNRGAGRIYQKISAELEVEVAPVPAAWTSGSWLPALQLSADESWSKDPATLQLGESATRVLTLSADGVLGAQLPPLAMMEQPGLKFYPEQPLIEDVDAEHGVSGRRVETTAVVVTRPGRFEIPELRIPWWNTATNQHEWIVVPGRVINVPIPEKDTSSQETTYPANNLVTGEASAAAANIAGQTNWWQVAAITMGLGWTVTVLLLYRKRRNRSEERLDQTGDDGSDEKESWGRLKSAIQDADLSAVRTALQAWATHVVSDGHSEGIEGLGRVSGDSELQSQLLALENSLYGPDTLKPDLSILLAHLEQFRREYATGGTQSELKLPGLYHH